MVIKRVKPMTSPTLRERSNVWLMTKISRLAHDELSLPLGLFFKEKSI